jgi:hypothetical protein
MKKNLLIALLFGILCVSFTLNVVQAYDLSAFTSTQQYQLENWWGEKWSAYFDGNFSVQPISNTGVIREEGTGIIYVKQIVVTSGEDNRTVTITPDGIECLDASREPKLCQIPLP